VGLLNDDTTEVGRVHLGVVFVADAGSRPVAIRETSKLRGAFATAGQVRAVADRLETWSQLIFEQLDGPAQRSVRL
jgi:predicted NUDIX family phosphoesterase